MIQALFELIFSLVSDLIFAVVSGIGKLFKSLFKKDKR